MGKFHTPTLTQIGSYLCEVGTEIHSRPELKYGFHLADFYKHQNHSKSYHEYLLHHSRSKSHMQHTILQTEKQLFICIASINTSNTSFIF